MFAHTFVAVTSVLSVNLLGSNVFVIIPFAWSIVFTYKSNFVWSSAFATTSSIVYVILFPFSSYNGNSVNVCFQSSFAVTTCSATTISPFFTCNLIEVIVFALAASLSMFAHTFVADISVLSVNLLGSNVFVITPFSIDLLYKPNLAWSSAFTATSSIVYVILFPALSYTGKSVNVCVQSSSAVTTWSAATSPFAFTCSFIDVIVFSLAASLFIFAHTFVADTSVVSVNLLGSNVFVITPFSIDLLYKSNFAWSSIFATTSSIVYVILFSFSSYIGKSVNVCVQSSSAVTTASSATSPFTFNCNFIESIILALAASLSIFFHTFVTVISVAAVSSVGFVSFPPTVATFDILLAFKESIFFTITTNDFEIVPSAGTLIFSHNSISLLSDIFAPSAELAFNSVPSGTLSLIVVIPSTFPVLFNVIVYLISSPTLAISTFCPSLFISLVFSLVIIAVFSSLLSSPFATAIFEIVPSIFSFTITVNLTEVVSPVFTSTSHFTPKISSFSDLITVPSFSTDSNVVFDGILSVTSIFSTSFFPLFFTVIVYVIF